MLLEYPVKPNIFSTMNFFWEIDEMFLPTYLHNIPSDEDMFSQFYQFGTTMWHTFYGLSLL